jgi:site-specific DNA-cytosine methylase
MRVLVACEYSGVVRDAFLAAGHDAMSCDLLPTDVPGPHHQGDVFDVIDKGWDLMIAHPPCTHLAVSGAKHFAKKRADGRQQEGIDFFMKLSNIDIPMVCLENPVSIMSTVWRKPDQIIQPWQFGDEFQKTTCLWLKGLPPLVYTNIVGKGEFVVTPSGKRLPKWYPDNKNPKHRSKTFPGIAQAMAQQWGSL